MSKQAPAELAAEQSEEVRRWLARLNQDRYLALVDSDYATIAHLHKALTRVMGNYQKFQRNQEALQANVIQHMIDEAKKEEDRGVVETD